jgi:hypothetical protein
MGEGRIKIDALDKLMKRGKYAPVKKAAGGMLKSAPNKGVTKLPKDVRNKMGFMKKGGTVKTHTMPDGTKMKGAKHGMKAGGYVLSAKDKTRKEYLSLHPLQKEGYLLKNRQRKK